MSFSCKKGKLDWCFNRFDRPVEKLRPVDRKITTGRSTQPVSITEVDIKNKLTLTKIGGAMMGFPPKTGSAKFKLFNLLS